jgi:hypothetical protein
MSKGAAQILGLTPASIRRLAQAGLLPVVLTQGSRLRSSSGWLDRFHAAANEKPLRETAEQLLPDEEWEDESVPSCDDLEVPAVVLWWPLLAFTDPGPPRRAAPVHPDR